MRILLHLGMCTHLFLLRILNLYWPHVLYEDMVPTMQIRLLLNSEGLCGE